MSFDKTSNMYSYSMKHLLLQEAIFGQTGGLRAAVGGDPGAAAFLMAGLPGKRAMELTDRLTDEGVDGSRLLFNEFF